MVADDDAAAALGASALSKISWRLLPLIGIGYGIAISVAVINSVGIAGGFVGPVLWGVARDGTGSFQFGLMALAAAFVVAAAVTLLVRYSARQSPLPQMAVAEPGATR